jgi:hypothetical protein
MVLQLLAQASRFEMSNPSRMLSPSCHDECALCPHLVPWCLVWRASFHYVLTKFAQPQLVISANSEAKSYKGDVNFQQLLLQQRLHFI